MKKQFITCICVLALTVVGCKKKNTDDGSQDAAAVTEQQVLDDFANILANPNYLDIETKASALNISVRVLDTATTDENLAAARDAWRAVRQPWERAEGYLFGPVEDFNYDPAIDDWPVNKVDMDSLLASSNGLTLADIDALPTSLKGFHPIEYMLFGLGGKKKAADLTARERLYLVSLTQSLYNTTAALRNSWDVSSGNFTTQLTSAGNGSVRFSTRKDAFITIVTAMAGICDEVANGKMEEPLTGAGGLPDSTLEESQFSHNSTTDFKNNMIGVQNVYLGKYFADGYGLNELVAQKNRSLDNALQSQISVAISSFNAIDSNYGAAVYYQAVQIHNAQDAINTLKEIIEDDLMNFIVTNIKD